jgi:hypothetical protein
MDNNNELSKLERLTRRLYSRKNPVSFEDKRSEITPGTPEAPHEWKSDQDAAALEGASRSHVAVKKGSFFSRLFVISLVFFLICLGVAAAVFYGGWNRISPNNVDISVLGPVSVAAGDTLPLDIIVKNNNALDLTDAKITVHYPDSTRSPDNLTVPLATYTEDIGPIPAGQSVQRTVKAVLYGEKDEVQEITVTADYSIKASTASYEKDKKYQIAIASSPVIMTVSYPKEIPTGRDTEFDLDITSNTNTELDNVVVHADYPFGFTFNSSDPAPYADNNLWHVGTLKPLEKKHLIIHGTLEAQDNEERTFTFTTGTADPNNDRQIGINLSTSVQSITVKKPEIALNLLFSNQDKTLAIPASGNVNVGIDYKNNLPVNLVNAQIVAKLTGLILDKSLVAASNNGYYRSLDNTVTWDMNTTQGLSQIAPGAESAVNLNFITLKTTPALISALKNPQVTLDVTMSGTRLVDGGVPQLVTQTVSKTVQVETEFGITGRVVYSVGPFKNTGPVPPKVDTETTYTVIWDATNSFNDASNVKVSATLPPYVTWKGVSSPSAEKVSFDPITRTVTWDIGSIDRGVGYLSSPREAAFQVGVTPSTTHLSTVPTVLNESQMTGTDTFTKQTITATQRDIGTSLSTDPNYGGGSGNVVP